MPIMQLSNDKIRVLVLLHFRSFIIVKLINTILTVLLRTVNLVANGTSS